MPGWKDSKVLILLLFLFVSSTPVFSANCNGLTQYTTPDCDGACTGTNVCESDDGNDGIFCCVDPAAVPELPSWFGPFFLATAVAGWEYLRQRRRKYAPIK